MPGDREGGRHPERETEKRRSRRDDHAIERIGEEIVAPEQLDEVLERRREEEPGWDRRDLSARLEGRERGPSDWDREHDEYDRELHRISRFEELPSHHATALRSRAKTSTEPSTRLDSVTMMALA